MINVMGKFSSPRGSWQDFWSYLKAPWGKTCQSLIYWVFEPSLYIIVRYLCVWVLDWPSKVFDSDYHIVIKIQNIRKWSYFKWASQIKKTGVHCLDVSDTKCLAQVVRQMLCFNKNNNFLSHDNTKEVKRNALRICYSNLSLDTSSDIVTS